MEDGRPFRVLDETGARIVGNDPDAFSRQRRNGHVASGRDTRTSIGQQRVPVRREDGLIHRVRDGLRRLQPLSAHPDHSGRRAASTPTLEEGVVGEADQNGQECGDTTGHRARRARISREEDHGADLGRLGQAGAPVKTHREKRTKPLSTWGSTSVEPVQGAFELKE